MSKKLVIALMLMCLLGSCSSISADPREGGLLGGLKGICTGAYDKRIQDRKALLESRKSSEKDLQGQSEALQNEAQSMDQKLSFERDRLREMENGLADMERNINRLRAKSSSQKAELEDLDRKVTILKREVEDQQKAVERMEGSGGASADPERYQMLVRKRDKLVKMLNALQESTKNSNEVGH